MRDYLDYFKKKHQFKDIKTKYKKVENCTIITILRILELNEKNKL